MCLGYILIGLFVTSVALWFSTPKVKIHIVLIYVEDDNKLIYSSVL